MLVGYIARDAMEIFKTYDIRGIYPTELNQDKAFLIGRAIATLAKDKKIFVNMDTRRGSRLIKERFLEGIMLSGGKVYDMGLGPIMEAAYASYKERAFGVSITASHNPAQYTGLKTFDNGIMLSPLKIKKIYDNKKFAKGNGSVTPHEIRKTYIGMATKGSSAKGLRIGVDSMGGATTHVAGEVLKKLGATPFMLHEQISDDFYGRQPEPKAEHAKELGQLVKKNGLDFGIQFDADGDRVAFVDEKGRFIEPVIAGLILIKYKKYKRALINVSCSNVVREYAKVDYCRTGTFFFVEKMISGKHVFGMESSSHYYFAKYHPFSEGIVGAVLIADIVAKTGKAMSELVGEFPKLHYKTENIHFSDANEREEKMKDIEGRARKFGKVNRLDGIRIDFKNGFMLFRKSGTEPIIRVCIDADSESAFHEIEDKADEIVGRD